MTEYVQCKGNYQYLCTCWNLLHLPGWQRSVTINKFCSTSNANICINFSSWRGTSYARWNESIKYDMNAGTHFQVIIFITCNSHNYPYCMGFSWHVFLKLLFSWLKRSLASGTLTWPNVLSVQCKGNTISTSNEGQRGAFITPLSTEGAEICPTCPGRLAQSSTTRTHLVVSLTQIDYN